eukprot:5297327-Pyramimonas_sp.AAC.5
MRGTNVQDAGVTNIANTQDSQEQAPCATYWTNPTAVRRRGGECVMGRGSHREGVTLYCGLKRGPPL